MRSGRYVLGAEVEAFEAEWAAYCDNSDAVAVGSGCDALELALRAVGVGPGDEVVVPSHTFIATWLAVSATGATPVPAEPDAVTMTLDPAAVDAAVTRRTRAVVPVHLYGRPADLGAITAVAHRHRLAVVEDAAQAPGAALNGRRIGAAPSTVAFSFYPGKNLGAFGDSGCVVTSDPTVAERVRVARNYGSREKYDHEVVGTNSRTDELQAAFLRVKLKRLSQWNDRRGEVAARYLHELPAELDLPGPQLGGVHAWHQFVVRTPDRDALRAALRAEGVETLVHYPNPVHLSGAYSEMGLRPGDFPIAERLAREALSLPIGPHLWPEQVDQVIAEVRKVLARGFR
ncbi:DegT/DnrJ/EryC1/StrS family aminotransferase [Aeromicrobium sp. CF3.5]|uniref:DegT/DnrJ/EryC1/StrS family aminotransferase n=1 Tax=Aeromicrobium sp. CF3.5 TaxID=3373078 RepID=UPI003EE45440